jgi:hypothetical protein
MVWLHVKRLLAKALRWIGGPEFARREVAAKRRDLELGIARRLGQMNHDARRKVWLGVERKRRKRLRAAAKRRQGR